MENFDMLSFSLNNQVVESKLSDIASKIKDLTQPFTEAGEDLLDYYGRQTFDNQGFNGQSWAPWAFSTITARLKRTGHYSLPPEREDQILVWTGNLHRGFIKAVQSMKLTISNTVEYFQYHQLGQRKMLALNATVIVMVRTRIEAYAKLILSR